MNKKKSTANKKTIPQLPSEIIQKIEEIIPEPQKQKELKEIVSVVSKQYSAPLPPPEMLKQFDEVLPGLAERIVRMAETQSNHRISLESFAVPEQLRQSRRGQYFGFTIAVLFLFATIFLSYTGHDEVAGILGGGTLVSLVTIFVTGKIIQKKEISQ